MIIDTPKISKAHAIRSAFLSAIYMVDPIVKRSPVRSTEQDRVARALISAEIDRLEVLAGALHIPAGTSLKILRGFLVFHCLHFDGIEPSDGPHLTQFKDSCNVHIWWLIERCGLVFRDSDEWRGNVYKLRDLLIAPANGLTPAERAGVPGVVYINQALRNGMGRPGRNYVSFAKAPDYPFVNDEADEWSWIIQHGAVILALE